MYKHTYRWQTRSSYRIRFPNSPVLPSLNPFCLYTTSFLLRSPLCVSQSDAFTKTAMLRKRRTVEIRKNIFFSFSDNLSLSLCQYISSLYFLSVLFSPITSHSFSFPFIPKPFFSVFSPFFSPFLFSRSGAAPLTDGPAIPSITLTC